MHAMFKTAILFNSDLSKWDVSKVMAANYTNPLVMHEMFQGASSYDRTICGNTWAALNAFDNSNGRSGCCNGGSYMSNPHATPFVVTDGGGSCSKCNGLIILVNNSDVACPDIHDMVRDWLKDETKAIVKYGHISE